MSKLTDGEVAITLNGQDRFLRPTLKAMTNINRHFKGIANARTAIVDADFEGICVLLRFGLDLSDKEAAALPERVYRHGLTNDLLLPLVTYVAVLMNGGRPLPEDDGAPPKGGDSDQGNE